MQQRIPVLRKERGATEGEWGNLFALGAQQRQRQAERQQRANKALRCGGGELLEVRAHCPTIAHRP